jgi:excinuclease UvrABC nuclease subunit
MKLFPVLTSSLEDHNILPISDLTWSSFNINHIKPEDEQTKKRLYNFIKSQVKDHSGIYIYKKDNELLYIGKAKLLYDRLKSHYIESFSPVPGDTKDMRWHRFFSSHQGELTVYWKEFEDEEDRQLVEIILTRLYKPAFIDFI